MTDEGRNEGDPGRCPSGESPNDFGDLSATQASWVRHGSHLVPESVTEVRLDRYLSERFTYRTRTQWVEIIKSGRIQVNGGPARPSRLIRPGTHIAYEAEALVEPPVSFEFQVLLEDADILAVDKPGDLPVHPSGRYFRNTLLCRLLEARGQTLDQPGIRIVHRLDRETSGVIIFGKTRESTATLAGQFEARTAQKEYLLLVHGRPEPDEFQIDGELGSRRGSLIRKAVGVVPDGEGVAASTGFRTLARGPEHSLLLARPHTGRLHQIRVHSEHAGYPIVGDKMYGLDERFFLRFIEAAPEEAADAVHLVHSRQCLHAYRLQVDHPRTGTRTEIVAPLPRDLVEVAGRLGIPIPEGIATRSTPPNGTA